MENEITNTIVAHAEHPKKPSKAYRKWDGKTPYWIHPFWCATTIRTETSLDETTREDGYLALLYHDIKEDTTFALPKETPKRIETLVNEMTFEGGSQQEMQEIWGRSREVRLYKLYDKVSNLMDGSWMNPEKRKDYEEYTRRLLEDIEKNFGTLNITKIARGLLESGK